MHASLRWWLLAQLRSMPSLIAQDQSQPIYDLRRRMRQLTTRWEDRFGEAAPRLARYFSRSVAQRSDKTLRDILKRAGIAVEFQTTPLQTQVLGALIEGQVGLIRSIAQEHLADVTGLVSRSVLAGSDLGTLTRELENRYGVTRKRAALIARHQNNMANAVLTRVRQQQLGIRKAIWMHSLAGREPRRTHLANHNKEYDVTEGWYDPDPRVRRRVYPGELINCRCISKSIIPGLADQRQRDRYAGIPPAHLARLRANAR
jgi:uncharacterized protein with gpF-like domain